MCLCANNMPEAAGNIDVDVDCALEKACRVFGVSKLFPQKKNAITDFTSWKDVLVTSQRVWQVAHIPDCSRSR